MNPTGRILVTGGNGFIGSHVVRNLAARSAAVTVLQRQTDEAPAPHASTFLADIRDAEAVHEAVGLADGVIHAAGILGTQELLESPTDAVDVNVQGSLNVFEACRHHDKPCVYVSVANYWMNNPYAITKHLAERFALMYNAELGTRIAVVRAANVYGPGQRVQPVKKVVPTFILSALRGEDLVVYGDGGQIMDMIYVDDVAEILVRALLLDHEMYDKAIEAGMGKDTTVKQLAELAIEECGSPSKVRRVEMRPGEEPDSVVRAEVDTLKVLGIAPEDLTPLREGIKRTVEWYRTHTETEASPPHSA